MPFVLTIFQVDSLPFVMTNRLKEKSACSGHTIPQIDYFINYGWSGVYVL